MQHAYNKHSRGVAQRLARHVRDVEAGGSNPLTPTNFLQHGKPVTTSFTVASSSKLIDTIGGDIRDHEVVILDFSDTVYVDDSAALVVGQLIETAESQETHCIVMGLSGMPAHNLRALDVLKRVPGDQVVETWDEARVTAARPLTP